MERKRLAGLVSATRRKVSFGTGISSPDADQQTFQRSADAAERELAAGRTVVLDTTFRQAMMRGAILEAAARAGAWVIDCVSPPEVVHGRLRERAARGVSGSDADIEVYGRQRSLWEPVAEVPSA